MCGNTILRMLRPGLLVGASASALALMLAASSAQAQTAATCGDPAFSPFLFIPNGATAGVGPTSCGGAATGDFTTAVGSGATATTFAATAVGAGTNTFSGASGALSVAVGGAAHATGQNATAIGGRWQIPHSYLQ